MFFNYTGLEHWCVYSQNLCVYKITYDMYGESLDLLKQPPAGYEAGPLFPLSHKNRGD
jgi:hypothetical protein